MKIYYEQKNIKGESKPNWHGKELLMLTMLSYSINVLFIFSCNLFIISKALWIFV